LFNEAIPVYQLDILTPLSDGLPSLRISIEDHERPITMKRIIKSVDRSLRHLDECLQMRQPYQKVFGVIQGSYSELERRRSAHETARRDVDGFLLEGLFLGENEEERVKLVETIISALPTYHVRMIYGCSSPEDILEMVRLGIDLFDSTYPFRMADEGVSWTARSVDSFEKLHLSDSLYQADRMTLAEGCLCFSCKQGYMRGYIHHLLKMHEMLASVLLSV
jgi:tRNA-guanine family transglycosylase